jgi:hypothetical protein
LLVEVVFSRAEKGPKSLGLHPRGMIVLAMKIWMKQAEAPCIDSGSQENE